MKQKTGKEIRGLPGRLARPGEARDKYLSVFYRLLGVEDGDDPVHQPHLRHDYRRRAAEFADGEEYFQRRNDDVGAVGAEFEAFYPFSGSPTLLLSSFCALFMLPPEPIMRRF